jgi:predicted O-methyltransferase YrrM
MPFANPPQQKPNASQNIQQVLELALHSLNNKKLTDAERLFSEVLSVSPKNTKALRGRALSRYYQGKNALALKDFDAAFKTDVDNEALLQDYVTALVEAEKEELASEVCDKALESNSANITALVGRDWVLNKIAPPWHIPMMNEKERNEAYFQGLKDAQIQGHDLVFEIGTGSGLLSLMAAKLGAEHVVTCEAKKSVANIAKKVVKQNGLANKINVIASTSSSVQIGKQLSRKADVLVHEIFSSELLNEGVLPAIEDAKKRLLAPNARIVPAQASVMVALAGGDEIFRNYRAGASFGFDLSEFNNTQPRKLPIFREDLNIELMSKERPAFTFDFQKQSEYPAEKKMFDIEATSDGLCIGLVQWIKIDFSDAVFFDNHPNDSKDTSNWQRILYRFDDPIEIKSGDMLSIEAVHDRSRPWFSLSGKR